MPWFNVCDSFWSHPKFLQVDLAATGLWVRAGSWCAQNLTDGWLPDSVLPLVSMGRDVADSIASLEAAGLWIRGVGGWQFNDWTDWNKPRSWHEEQRQRHRDRQRAYEERKRQSDGVPDVSDDTSLTPSLTTANPTQPNPLPVDVVGNADVAVPADRSAIANDKRFDAFWAIAVRKTGKGAARKALDRACKKTSEHHLAAAWRTANQAWATWPDRSKIPHPATWLNQERWDDQPPQPHNAAATSKTLSALQRADQMEIADDTSRLPETPRASLAAGPTGHAG